MVMPVAFVLINTDPGAEEEILKKIKAMEEAKEAYIIYGAYDIIVKIETESMERTREVITWKIRRMDKVRSTLTMHVVE